MIKLISKHITIKQIISSIFIMFMINIFVQACVSVVTYTFELVTPVSMWVRYYSVEPLKDSFKKWDKLKFVSTVQRSRSLDTQRQDTLYCQEWTWQMEKLKTQFRPKQWSEIMKAHDKRTTIWAYTPKIPEYVTSCKMCWVVLWKTKDWISKNYEYCTTIFSVNQ